MLPKIDVYGALLEHKYMGPVQRDRCSQGAANLLSSPTPGPSGACTASADLARAFVGEALASAVNRSGSHNVRQCNVRPGAEGRCWPYCTHTALGNPGPVTVPPHRDIPKGALSHLAHVLNAAQAPWPWEASGSSTGFGLLFLQLPT